ncbi:MAG TPA: putative phage abortive infection protein, partial [Verrucomicrobiae bacterium]
METEQNPKPRKTEFILKWGILISTIAAFAFVIAGFVAWHWVHQEDKPSLNDWGNYGSYLQGTVASLWSLAGTLLIFVAFLAQKQQLLRQETELKNQEKQFELQQQSIKLQNFENSFFQLLNQQSQIVAAMQTLSGNREGRNCFKGWFEDKLKYTFGNEWRKSATGMQQRIVPDEKQYAIKCYEIFYKDYQHYLGHYFRNLYHIIKFVNEAEVLKADDERVEYKTRRRYASLVRAQLSVYELCLIFYNGLSSEGVKFKPLIEKF